MLGTLPLCIAGNTASFYTMLRSLPLCIARNMPGLLGKLQQGTYTAWTIEIGTKGSKLQPTRETRHVLSFILAWNTASMHSSEHCLCVHLRTLPLCTARNNASVHSWEHCLCAQLGTMHLCTARNTTTVHSSEQCICAQLGTRHLCTARNTTTVHSLEHYLFSPNFYCPGGSSNF